MKNILTTTYGKFYLEGNEEKYQELIKVLKGHYDERLEEILTYLNISEFYSLGLEVWIFDNENNYKKNHQERGGNVATYSHGSFDDEHIYIVITDENLEKMSLESILNRILHETVHVIYYNYYLNRDDSKRITWFDEGLAYNLSGEMSTHQNLSLFKNFFLKHIVNRHMEIPKIEYLMKHGMGNEKFKSSTYDGYNISYIILHYLMEVMPEEQFFNLLGNYEELIAKGEKYLSDAIRYYNTLFPVKEHIEDIENAQELLDYMNKNMAFGFYDKDGKVIKNTLDRIKELYRIVKVDKIIEAGYGTCIENMQLASYVLKKLGYEVKVYSLMDLAHLDSYRFMFIILFNMCDEWYTFLYINSQNQGINKIKDPDKYIVEYQSNMEKAMEGSEVIISEIDEIPVGLTYDNLHRYLIKQRKNTD